MKQLIIAGVQRQQTYSPNHIGNDAAIFRLTAKHLKQMGCVVNEYTEADLIVHTPSESVIFNMVRDGTSVKKLQELEDKGVRVINSGYGIENCTRGKMTEILIQHQIPHPKSLIVSTLEDNMELIAEAGFETSWIKRGDFHAIHREDVTYVRHQEEAVGILKEYALRGIESAVINEHLKGDLVKFYGVYNTDFYYWFYPTSNHHSKFGLEQINGSARGYAFDLNELKKISNRAAQALNTHIYGGDCIIAEDGTIRLIDFNDWPSFAPCRKEAAPYIAQCIYDFASKK